MVKAAMMATMTSLAGAAVRVAASEMVVVGGAVAVVAAGAVDTVVVINTNRSS